jgi:hypothetical protein
MADVLTHMPSRLTATIRSANGDRPQSRLCRFCLIGVACAWVAAHRAAAHVRQSALAARQQFTDHALLWLVPATTVASLTPLGDINGIPDLSSHDVWFHCGLATRPGSATGRRRALRTVDPPRSHVPQNVRYAPKLGGAGAAYSSRPGRSSNGCDSTSSSRLNGPRSPALAAASASSI